MALQSFTLTVGAAKDSDNNDKNYVSGEVIYIKKTNGTLASLYRDLAGTSQIAQDGLSNVTDSKGQFNFFVDAGDYVAEYGNQSTPITVVGPDYFNSRIDETVNQVIIDLSTSRGFRVKGTFATGFTYELPNDVGLDASGNYWIYTDVDSLPFTVPAATTPAPTVYMQVTFNQAGNITTSKGRSAQDYFDDYANLKDTATGDGIADDTASWNNFIAGGSGLIPPGSYKVDGVVKTYLSPIFVNTKLNNQTLGLNTFESNTTGYNNTAFGNAVLQDNTSGFDNLAVGVQAMRKNTTGNRNTAVGVDALAKNTTGDHNLALGQNALGFNTVGTYNTALGIDALEYGENNNFNVAIGQYAGLNLEGSNNNTVCGYNTFQAATSGNSNVAYGKDSLRDQNGVDGNTAIGSEAARGNTSGTNITAVGFRAARTNTSGTHLTAIGDQALFKNTTGVHNVSVGFTSLYSMETSDWNTALGDGSLFSATGGNNTGVGGNAGYSVTTGTENTFIGYNAGFSGNQKVDANNSTAIGRGAFTTEDNVVQLGNASVAKLKVGVNSIAWFNAAPTSGTWVRGDVVWNLAASAGGIAGWVCVTAGTPGTWKAMAALEA